MSHDPPNAEAALRQRWRCLPAGDRPSDRADAVLDELLARYAEPHRAYHNLDHLLDCLAEIDAVRDRLADARAVELAIWFHDAVYDPRRSDNEQRSADLAVIRLGELKEPADRIERVGALVLDTTHAAEPASADGRLLIDADLSVLGKSPAAFDNYDRAIRVEYAHVPEDAYRTGRAAVLRKFLVRSAIYATPWFRERYERQARENVARAIRSLGGH